jgi:hypothetical protein
MGWKDLFRKNKKQSPETDPLKDYHLKKLEPGYYVDYDMKTWQVTSHDIYEWGSGDITHEWQLKSADEIIYLELESDDEDYWSISRKIAFSRLGNAVKNYLMKHDDPPDEINFEGTLYYLEEMGGGKFLKNGTGSGKELLSWDYENDSGDKLLSVEQWGEEDFEASVGYPVEEYQFLNILPGKREDL